MKNAMRFGAVAALLSSAVVVGGYVPAGAPDVFQEKYWPQFHYTTAKGWINDPIGLVFFQGEYHLFNDHNPFSRRFPGGKTGGEQSHWSHAVSADLMHWRRLPIAVYPDANGACWSGSGVVDWKNSAGFQTGKEPPLVLIYTSAGASFGQSLVYSNDRGRTWKKYEGNPVLGQIAPSNRDPNVFWHEPTKQWVMALYVKRGLASFFNSPDLKRWTPTAEVPLQGFHECPDLFELPGDGDRRNMKWVLDDARFQYWIGAFDGRTFKPETGPLRGDFGKNFYAAQSWSDAKDRRVQIGWMRWMGNNPYPGISFNQQLSFPGELTLRTLRGGVKLHRYPVQELEELHAESVERTNLVLKPGDNPLANVAGALFDLQLELEPDRAAEFGLRRHELSITYSANRISCLGATAEAAPTGGKLRLRILVDRTSLEVFVNDGEISMTSGFLPEEPRTNLELYAKGGAVRINSLSVHKLQAAWTSSSAGARKTSH